MVAAGWSEAQKRAYVLADNQLAITGAGWDTELLRLELGELNLAGFDLSLRRVRAPARGGSENQRPWPADKVERWSISRSAQLIFQMAFQESLMPFAPT
jgi:hypothetical protein